MTTSIESRLTPNLVPLAFEDLEETLFTGVFKLVKIEEEGSGDVCCILYDGTLIQQFKINPLLSIQSRSLNLGVVYKVKFHHAYKTDDNLLYIDKIEPFKIIKNDAVFVKLETSKPVFKSENGLHLGSEIQSHQKLNNVEDFSHKNLNLTKKASLEIQTPLTKISIKELSMDFKDWIIEGVVSEKSNLKKYSKSDEFFFDIHVNDDTGKIRVVFWKDTSQKCFNLFKEDDKIRLSGLTVKNESKYNRTNVPFELYMNIESKVEIVEEEDIIQGRKQIKTENGHLFSFLG